MRIRAFGALTLLVTASTTACGRGDAAGPHTTFKTPEDAVAAFVAAARANNTAALDSMLGPGSDNIVTSSDTIADRAERARFVERYDEAHDLVPSGTDTLILDVGTTDWPVPIPLVKEKGNWHWDGAAGREEIFYRRIGHNELKAISVCRGVVDAQAEYAASGHDGHQAGAYAMRVVSTPGTQDGLYWPVKEGDPESPMGPGIAAAANQGYDTSGQPSPYHGYFYRVIPHGSGWGLVAWPADYRQSGVMTFQVSESGVVYQKDLGDATASTAEGLNSYAVDATWTEVPADQ